ncbi:MAG: DUF2970 domain-containing protein [Algiphilus sp.]
MSKATENDHDNAQRPLRFMELLQSVAAAMLGVQSDAARKRDFSRGKPLHFVIIGVVATVLFVLAVAGIVKAVLHLAGAQ